MIDYENIKPHIVISPFDVRDYRLEHLGIPTSQNFPDEFCLDLSNFKYDNQGIIGDCGGEAGACVQFIDEYKLTGNIKPFSVGWLYGNRDSANNYMGVGIVIKEMLDHMLKEGSVYAEDFPETAEMPQIYNEVMKVKANLLSKAALHKIGAYARISSITEIKTALMTLGAVIVTIPIYQSYYHIVEGMIPVPDPTKEVLQDTHAVVIVGWRADGKFICINWNGENYGDHGKFYIDYAFPLLEAYSVTKSIPQKPDPATILQQSIMCLQYDLNLDYNAKIALTGIEDAATVAALNGIQSLIVKGHRSHVVQWIQQRLISWGYLSVGDDTMIYDAKTFNAITELQKNWGRPTDGVLRIETWSIFLNN